MQCLINHSLFFVVTTGCLRWKSFTVVKLIKQTGLRQTGAADLPCWKVIKRRACYPSLLINVHGINHFHGSGTGRRGSTRKIHGGFRAISLCQVGPNGEGRLITAPAGDEWVSQAARRAGLGRCADRQIHTTSECVCVCVCICECACVCMCVCESTTNQKYPATCSFFAREQVCRRRLPAGIQSRVKTPRCGVNNHCDLTLTPWRGACHIWPAEATSTGAEDAPESHSSELSYLPLSSRTILIKRKILIF